MCRKLIFTLDLVPQILASFEFVYKLYIVSLTIAVDIILLLCIKFSECVCVRVVQHEQTWQMNEKEQLVISC